MTTRHIFLDIVASDPDADMMEIVSQIASIDPSLSLERSTVDDAGYGVRRLRLLLSLAIDYDIDRLIREIQGIDTVYSVNTAISYIT